HGCGTGVATRRADARCGRADRRPRNGSCRWLPRAQQRDARRCAYHGSRDGAVRVLLVAAGGDESASSGTPPGRPGLTDDKRLQRPHYRNCRLALTEGKSDWPRRPEPSVRLKPQACASVCCGPAPAREVRYRVCIAVVPFPTPPPEEAATACAPPDALMSTP